MLSPEMNTVVSLSLWILLCLSFWAPTQGAESTSPSQPRKTYRNPLLPEVVMADPHVIRMDGRYYLYATTHTKGYDAYVSDDLVHWEDKGLVFDDPRGGAWAPDVFHNRRGD